MGVLGIECWQCKESVRAVVAGRFGINGMYMCLGSYVVCYDLVRMFADVFAFCAFLGRRRIRKGSVAAGVSGRWS
jgi:hypothetical protein